MLAQPDSVCTAQRNRERREGINHVSVLSVSVTLGGLLHFCYQRILSDKTFTQDCVAVGELGLIDICLPVLLLLSHFYYMNSVDVP